MPYHYGRKLTARSQDEAFSAAGASGAHGAVTIAPATGASRAAATDAELLAAVAERRDRGAFVELFNRYAGRIKAFMMRGGATADAADEAAQEAMLILWRRADAFDPGRASAAAWIFTIARNKRIDLIRREKRPEPDMSDPLFAAEPATGSDKEAADKSRDEAVRQALETLPGDQLEVVKLAFFEGLSHAEIADRVDAPLGTVKSRLRLAFGRLRKALGDDFRSEL